MGNLTGLWLGNENNEGEVWVFNLSIWVKKERAGLNDRQFCVLDGRKTGRGEDREQTKSVWVEEEIARAPTSSSNQNRGVGRKGEGEKYQSRTRTKKKGGVISSKGGRQTFRGIDTWWCASGHAIRAQAPTTTALARRFTNRIKALRPRRKSRRRGRRGRGHGRVSRHGGNLFTATRCGRRSGVEKTRKCPIGWLLL